MKILLSNKFFYPRGGDCIHMIGLKKLLEQQGHQVAIFAMDFEENLKNEYAEYWPKEVDFGSKSPISLISAVLRPFGVNEVKNKWNKLLNDFKPDMVHLHNIHSQLSPIIAKETKKLNIPVVWTLHDHKLVCPAYLFMDNNGNPCEECLSSPSSVIKKKCIKGSAVASVLGYLEAKKWSIDLLQEITDQFICPSLFLQNNMLKGGVDASKLTLLHNFVDDEKFENEIVAERKKEVVYVGRISLEKGVHTLCEAFDKIEDCKLTIIGDGPLKKELELKYNSDKINFLGFQTWDVIKNRLGSASFMVLPSECYENNPLTIIESLAVGTPVLGAAIGGIPELIKDSNGMLFESKNANDLGEKIEAMFAKTDWDYQKISKEASQQFSTENYYQQLMSLYQQ